MKELEKLLELGNDYKIEGYNEMKENNKRIKLIYVTCKKNKDKCPCCGRYTKSVHDKLKPIRVKYLDMAGYTTYLEITKRRFRCKECNKIFTENNYINNPGKKISIKLEQKILLDLRDYNLSLSYIAEHNNVSDNTVRKILKDYMKNYPPLLKMLKALRLIYMNCQKVLICKNMFSPHFYYEYLIKNQTEP